MGKKNKGSATGSATAAVSGFSDYDIVRAECEKAVRSLKNNPPRAQKLMKEACQKHPNVALGFRYYAHVEKRLAEQQHDASALKKRHVNAALEAAKRATALSPNSVEHAYFYAMLLHEYLPQQEGGKRNDEEAIAECKRALAIAEPVDPAEDMLGELPDALETAEEGVGHFKHRLRQLSHQMNLEGLQHIFKHVSVDANGNFVPLNTEPRPGMPSEQSISELISARERGKISGTEAGQTSQVRVQLGLESKEEGEQQNAYGDKRDAGEIGTSENGGTEGTWIGEVKSGGESASAKEGEEAGQVQSSVSAEPGTPRNSRKSGSATKEIAEPHEEDEDENYMTCKE